jgi:hypothetical protein
MIVIGLSFTGYGLLAKEHFMFPISPGDRSERMPKWLGVVFYLGIGFAALVVGVVGLIRHIVLR